MKRALVFFVLAMCMAMLCSCHGSEGLPEFEIPDSFDESKEYEITFWAKNDTNITQVEIYKNTISDFEKLYPNIKVNLRLYTDYGKIYNDVITNIATSTTPNVCITYPDHIATYLSGSNTVVPLDELFDNEKYGLGGNALKYDSPKKEEIVPQFLSECVIGNNHYALPFMRSTEACYVNKTYVEALGYELPEMLTWEFVFEVAEPAAKKNNDGTYALNGQNVMLPFIYKSTDNMMIQLLKQQNAEYSTDSGDVRVFGDATRQILSDVASLTEKGAFSTFKISGYPANFLNAGQCVFAVDSTAGATWMGPHAPLIDISEDKLVDFEIEVLPVPQTDTHSPKMISQGPSVCIFNKKDAGEVMASWLFTQYLLTNEVQRAYSSTEGYVPVALKAWESPEYVEYISKAGIDNELYYDVKIKASKLLMDNIDNTFVTPVFNGSASLRDASGQMIENVTKAVRRKKTVDDVYIDELFLDMNSLYRLDQKSSGAFELKEHGELPAESKILLITLGAVWVIISVGAISDAIKKRKK